MKKVGWLLLLSMRREAESKTATVRKPRTPVKKFMRRAVRLRNCCFTELSLEDAQLCPDRTVKNFLNMQLALMGPPFNICRESRFDSDYDACEADHIYDVPKVVSKLLRQRGDDFIMRSKMQLAQ